MVVGGCGGWGGGGGCCESCDGVWVGCGGGMWLRVLWAGVVRWLNAARGAKARPRRSATPRRPRTRGLKELRAARDVRRLDEARIVVVIFNPSAPERLGQPRHPRARSRGSLDVAYLVLPELQALALGEVGVRNQHLSRMRRDGSLGVVSQTPSRAPGDAYPAFFAMTKGGQRALPTTAPPPVADSWKL